MAKPQPTRIVSFRPMTPELEHKQARMWRRILEATAKAVEGLPEDVDDGTEVPGPYSVEKLTATHGRILKDSHRIPLTRYTATIENCRIAVNALNRYADKTNACADTQAQAETK
jgi:hypothetical protein